MITLFDKVYLTKDEKQKILFCSVLHPFQDYFNSYETGQSVGGVKKRTNLEKNKLAYPQAELDLSHICPVQGSNKHQKQQ